MPTVARPSRVPTPYDRPLAFPRSRVAGMRRRLGLPACLSKENLMARDDQSQQGVLEMHPKGFGFLRNAARNYSAGQADVYVPAPLIQRLGLREGLLLGGPVEGARKGTGPRLAQIEQIEGLPPEQFRRRNFDDLTPVDPHQHILLETGTEPLTTR